MNYSAYMRLARLHQPAGILLLLWPCWWSLALAAGGVPPVDMMALFAIGAFLMRPAGCIVNDIADRKFDAHVERTRNRPLASGELSLKQGIGFLVLLLMLSLAVAFQLGTAVLMWAALALIPVAIYPFMKRISWWPQLFLGLTFNWGALMGWAAITGEVNLPALLLYAGGIFWTLGYDTIYAHQDKEDDIKIGVKSTALYLGKRTKPALLGFYLLAVLFWAVAGLLASASLAYYTALTLALAHFTMQIHRVDLDFAPSCRQIFLSNAYQLGAVMFVGCVAA
ncbi:MAG: 4-hydroxybenzoate octaprenyltransferase [Alphaproteobacteria bacterium]